MKDYSRERQLINNELLARAQNKRVKRALKDYIPKNEQPDVAINFHCECSDKQCDEKIALTIKEYESLHADNARFVLAKGHQTPIIENIDKVKDDFLVVKKPALQSEQPT
jgi:hypothetical protein